MELLNLANQVVEGELNPLKVYIQLKQIESELEEAMKIVQPLAIDEADKYTGKSFQAFGAMIEKKNGASRWDYSNVSTFNYYKSKLEYVQKIAQAGGGFTEEGEQIEPAVKVEGKSTISVKLINK